ncbi:MAG: hypothetical protein D6740_05785 [Alphaproteobacteria bacterium]|nr:MAG: hypothetical protein D6740_05785 [Alphaproteobacteria bacterium]
MIPAPPPATTSSPAAQTGSLAPADASLRGALSPGTDMPFVWAAYGISLLVLVMLWWRSRQLLRRAGEIAGREEPAREKRS